MSTGFLLSQEFRRRNEFFFKIQRALHTEKRGEFIPFFAFQVLMDHSPQVESTIL